MSHTQKTEKEEKQEKAKAIQAIVFDTLKHNSVLYWHYLTIKESEGV